MFAATSRAGVRIMVSSPIAWQPGLQEANVLVRNGAIGRVFNIVQRSANPGKEDVKFIRLHNIRHDNEMMVDDLLAISRFDDVPDGARESLEHTCRAGLEQGIGPTGVTTTEMEGAAVSERRVTGSFEEPFRRELQHIHHCISEGKDPLANVSDAKKDIEFLRDIVLCGMKRARR